MIASSHGKEVFRFMDLAPEIRNAIYDESLITLETRLECDLHLRAENMPATSLLVISKQFKNEYEDRLRYHEPKLTICDQWDSDFDEDLSNIELPPATKKITQVHINIIFSASAEAWTQHIVKHLPSMANLTVQIHLARGYFGGPGHKESLLNAVMGKNFENLPNLSALEVYYGPMSTVDSFPFKTRGVEKLLTFSAERRCLERPRAKEAEHVSAA